MEKRIQEILSTDKNEISEIANLNLNVLSNIEKGIHISRRHLQELRIVLRSGTFENKTDEINKTAYKKIMKVFDTYAKGVVNI